MLGLEIYNSPLTETAAIGFEYGYSVGADTDVVIWEAQFGDFVNVAQVMIDQFLSSGRQKWGQYSRLILLLPHGYEGQGPEHSSARLERFLQLCAEDNMRVAYPTTPAQYFHLLRRQALQRPERPLIVMTPKSLLRHPMALSMVADMTDGGFEPVLADPTVESPERITRLVLCSGKVYYDLASHDRRSEAENTAIARVELLYPFPGEALAEVVGSYPKPSRGRLDSGGAAQHGSTHVHRTSAPSRGAEKGPALILRTTGASEPCRGQGESAHRAAGDTRARRSRLGD